MLPRRFGFAAALLLVLVASLTVATRAGPGDDEPIGPGPYLLTIGPEVLPQSSTDAVCHAVAYNMEEIGLAYVELWTNREVEFTSFTYDVEYWQGTYAQVVTYDIAFTGSLPAAGNYMTFATILANWDVQEWFADWEDVLIVN